MAKAVHAGWLPVTIAAIAIGAVLLFFSISGILRVLREAEVARMPAKAEQSVTFREPGSYVLFVQQPRFDAPLRNATFSLRTSGGAEVSSSPSIFRTTVSGGSTARISVRNYEIAQPGTYRLLMSNVDAGADLSRCELIFTHPFAGALIARILLTVGGAIALIGGIVFTALIKTGKL